MDAFTLPDNLADSTTESLGELHAAALAAFEAAYTISPRTPDSLAEMRRLSEALNTINAEIEQRETLDADAERLAVETREAAAARAAATAQAEAEDEASASDEPPADDAPADDTPPAEEEAPASEPDDAPADEPAPADDAPVAEPDATATATVTDLPAPTAATDSSPAPSASTTDTPSPTEQEPMTVAASGNVPLPNIITNRGEDDAPAPAPRPSPTIVAAANLPNFNDGQELSLDDVASAFASRVRSFPKGPSGAARMQSNVAMIRKPFTDDLIAPERSDASGFLDYVGSENRLPGGTLVAAGGWCSPSETLYDLCAQESRDGLLSLPEIQVRRGGIRHTVGPDFRSIYDGTGYFAFSEADAIAGDYQPDNAGATGKPCMYVPCPDWEDVRLEVAGLCITAGILQDVTYPEMTRRFVDGSLVGHAHRLNAAKIAALVAGSDAVTVAGLGATTADILGALELQAEDMRYRNRLARGRTVEVVAPFWVRPMVRADLSRRQGVDMLSVSDAQVDRWFAERLMNVQYVYDWQDNFVDAGSTFGDAAPIITAWPNSATFLMYPSGTWVAGSSDVITLDAVYDSNNLPANNYIALFTEEGWLVAKRCHDSRVITVSGLCANGQTAAGADYTCA